MLTQNFFDRLAEFPDKVLIELYKHYKKNKIFPKDFLLTYMGVLGYLNPSSKKGMKIVIILSNSKIKRVMCCT